MFKNHSNYPFPPKTVYLSIHSDPATRNTYQTKNHRRTEFLNSIGQTSYETNRARARTTSIKEARNARNRRNNPNRKFPPGDRPTDPPTKNTSLQLNPHKPLERATELRRKHRGTRARMIRKQLEGIRQLAQLMLTQQQQRRR